MFESLQNAPRLLLEAELKPILGDRFQPTGFADLGAAVYQRPDGKRMLLVESAQSMANRLEQTCLDGNGPGLTPELKGLPYVLVKLTGATETCTSSLVEAHRINSPFIISNEKFGEPFQKRTGYRKGQPMDWKKIAAAVLFYDPGSLLHGVFMANLEDGRLRLPRAVTGFIEAEDVNEVASGGVKNNPIDPTGTIRAENYDKDVYSNVPYHRTEYTAARIAAYFNLDLALLRGYGLPQEALDLLGALALLKVRRFLSAGLRLRTACDFVVKGDARVLAPAAFTLASEQVLLEAVQQGIKACGSKGLFADPPVTELVTKVVLKKKKEGGEAPEEDEAASAS